MLKLCPTCRKKKPHTVKYFYVDTFQTSGFDSRCKECRKGKETAYKRANVAAVKAANRRYLPRARQLHAERQARRPTDIEEYFKTRVARSRRVASLAKVPFDLTTDFLLALYGDQLGLCFYTDVPMILGVGDTAARDRLQLSIDRVIPEDGYVQNNVVLCTVRANGCKSDLTVEELRRWMPTWYERIAKCSRVSKKVLP